ncbi:DNA-binding response regulator [Xylanibacillus composti]|uniref:DNA-binding response regulator n=1 Tax=Xylanibacillus composti TaxID=1572762 RepID=A0A8J4M3B5_9BACL|nr:response regulator transcription factor [Xylanibacillus composti]MDT9724724.1 DNA-binding response regulator [Xylanibacillus composti]GIQ70725.1 DNA-binding response regulator [Xylanibacillus composti]
MNKKILVVDDEPSISMLIEFNLKLAGFEVYCVYDGETVFEAIQTFRPDLIVLDLMLPKMDGYQVCKQLRDQKNLVPIIMLTAMQDLSDKIAGLDNGADDYMTKPFSPQELISRIRAIFRRTETAPAALPQEPIRIGSLVVHPDLHEVTVEGKPIDLTPKEFELLLFLCKYRGKVLSRQQLLHGVWDYHFLGDTRIVDVHISHLRDKIEKNARSPEYILTVRSVGYKLAVPATSESAV